jgi:hypothetical protein
LANACNVKVRHITRARLRALEQFFSHLILKGVPPCGYVMGTLGLRPKDSWRLQYLADQDAGSRETGSAGEVHRVHKGRVRPAVLTRWRENRVRVLSRREPRDMGVRQRGRGLQSVDHNGCASNRLACVVSDGRQIAFYSNHAKYSHFPSGDSEQARVSPVAFVGSCSTVSFCAVLPRSSPACASAPGDARLAGVDHGSPDLGTPYPGKATLYQQPKQ